MPIYLDFEKPIEDLILQIEEAKTIGEKSEVDVSKTISELENKLENKRIFLRKNVRRSVFTFNLPTSRR